MSKSIRLSDNLELVFNDGMTEVSINRIDNGACFIDIWVKPDGKLTLDYCDYDQWDRDEYNPLGFKEVIDKVTPRH